MGGRLRRSVGRASFSAERRSQSEGESRMLPVREGIPGGSGAQWFQPRDGRIL